MTDSIEALRRSEMRLRVIAENARDTIWTIAPDGTITYVSPAVAAVRGFTPEEAMQQSLHEIHPPETLARSATYFAGMLQAIAEGRTPEPFRGDFEYYRRDGSTFWTEVLAFPILDEHGQLIELLGVSRDLSERRAREEEERAAQRLDAMSRMAWGVSHEVNNALAIIQSSNELLAAQCAARPDIQETASSVEEAVGRIALLTSRLLAFSRRRPATPTPTGVGDLLRRLLPELESIALPTPLRLHIDEDVEQAVIRVDPALLAESLDILLRNAAEAAGRTGAIDVRCSIRDVGEPLSTRTKVLAPGRFVCVTVIDNGHGMSAEAIDRAFEPFHSTKADGRGRGLGLATVLGLAQQQGGGLTVDSSPGAGARFTLWWSLDVERGAAEVTEDVATTGPVLPTASQATTPGAWTHAATTAARTILLVDDDPAVLKVTARVLEHVGYTVVTANGAAEAITLASDGGIDLLVSDVRMPGVNGFELVQSLVANGIDLPVLFISGDVGATIPSQWAGRIAPRFLAKPFTCEQILQQLSALEAAKGP